MGPDNAGAIVANNITNHVEVAVPANLAYEDYNLIVGGYAPAANLGAGTPDFIDMGAYEYSP